MVVGTTTSVVVCFLISGFVMEKPEYGPFKVKVAFIAGTVMDFGLISALLFSEGIIVFVYINDEDNA